MADHLSPTIRSAFPSRAIISERSSPSRVRFAAPNNGAPLTAPGRSEQRFLIRGKGSLRTATLAGHHFAAILVPFFSATDMRSAAADSMEVWNLRTPTHISRRERGAVFSLARFACLSASIRASRARGGPLCRSTAAPARSAANRTGKAQARQTRFAQSPSARDLERSSVRRGLRKERTKPPIAAAAQASPRRLVATCSPRLNVDHPFGKSWSAILSMATSSAISAAPRMYLSGSVPDKCTRTSSAASERFSLMYKTRTPFEFHRPPTRRAPSPLYAG
jgi:hypothetical protein